MILLERINRRLTRHKRQWAFHTAVFRPLYRNYLLSLDNRRYRYVPEVTHYQTKRLDSKEKYLKFWFEEDLDPDIVFDPDQMLIGLHHSWTPDWYKELSQQEVLEHNCLLSRTLARILAN